MKVSDLIARLQKMPPELDFCYAMWDSEFNSHQYRIPKFPIIKVETIGEREVCVIMERGRP